MKKLISLLIGIGLLVTQPTALFAQEEMDDVEGNLVVTEEELGISEGEAEVISEAQEEEVEAETESGTLIEIGNTTAEETTVVVRVTDEEGNTEDKTVEIETKETDLDTADNTPTDLNDWIAGDAITYEADVNTNSNSIKARRVVNRTIRKNHFGRNGWIEAIRPDKLEADVKWQNTIYTLKVGEARIVAGLKNPATISDLKVGDRIRARVVEDGDGNNKTWNAKVLVVLRRGNALFMRVTRWVTYGEIAYIPEDATIPTTITIEVLPSRFYEEGDVNNLVGVPGEAVDVYISPETELRRRYLGKADIAEFNQGDRVQVIGRLNEKTGQLDAQVIRNTDIQMLGVATWVGTVVSVDVALGKIVADNIHRGEQELTSQWQVMVNSETKLHKQGDEITLSEVQVGDTIRVRGVASRTTKTVDANAVAVVTEQAQVKAHLKEQKDLKLEEFRKFRKEVLTETDEMRASSKKDADRLRKERERVKQNIKDAREKLRQDFKEWKEEKKEDMKERFKDWMKRER